MHYSEYSVDLDGFSFQLFLLPSIGGQKNVSTTSHEHLILDFEWNPFAARGGNLVYLVSLVDLVCLVQTIWGTKQTR